jgi:hypothetical protein
MAGLATKTPSTTYKDLLKIENSNSGVDDTLRQVESGGGTGSALYIEKNSIKVKPTIDDAALLDIHDKDGNSKFKVDTSSDLVSALGHYTNTQYAYFAVNSSDGIPSAANTHTAIPFGNLFSSSGELQLGTGTNPDTTKNFTIDMDDAIPMTWYVPDNITIDGVDVWVAPGGAIGDTIKFHLMTYDITTTTGVTCGDFSSGVVVADGSDMTSNGYEQANYQSLIVQNANVDSGNVCLLVMASDGTNGDYSVNATVKYHLR